MKQDWVASDGAAQPQAPSYIDGMLYNGVDFAATRREHLRALTTARQAAEHRYARQVEPGADRAQEFRAELARIHAAHQTWLIGQGEDVIERRTRRRRRSGTPQEDTLVVAGRDTASRSARPGLISP